MIDLFEIVKSQNVNLKDFLEENYGFQWKKNTTSCPFCDENKEKNKFSYSSSKNIVKCWNCDESGDLINFIVSYKKMTKLQAAMEILDCLKIDYPKPNDVQELTVEQKKEMQDQQDKIKKENLEKSQAKKVKEQIDRDKAIINSTRKAINFSSAFEDEGLFNHGKILGELFPNQTKEFNKWLPLYLGFDEKYHNSITILNRVNNDKKTCFCIKHRQKFEWDDINKKLLTTRNEGKWLSNSNSSIYAFPYSYYLTKVEVQEEIFLVEGEKDALNLLALGLNVLTLGGVANSWIEHKELLKDKKVYIWFDNDTAGYENAIRVYNEINDVTAETYITLFYHINNALPDKYDISDFIIDQNIKDKETILNFIAYSSYRLSSTLIEDISDYIDKDLSKYYQIDPLLTFQDIKKKWKEQNSHGYPKYIPIARGRMDIDNLWEFYEAFKETKKDSGFSKAKTELLQETLPKFAKDKEIEIDRMVDMFDQMFSNYSKLHKHYSQVDMNNIREAFQQMCKATDNTVAKFNNKELAIWTGKYYYILDPNKDDMYSFFMNDFLPMARVDHKKITSQNVDTVLKDILYSAPSLNELRSLQKDLRKINFLNGTLTITKRGKHNFKSLHNKNDAVTNILEFEYDPKAKAPKWKKFLNRILPDSKDQETLMQFMGYCFLPSHAYEAFLFLYGREGSNGKSVIMDVIRSFFGEENISSLQLQDFEGHKLHSLSNRIINIGTEIDADNLKSGQFPTLKALVSPKDTIQIDPKHKDPYSLAAQDKPKLIFAGNNKPKGGLDAAVFRRMLFINFDLIIGDDEKIRDLSERFHDEMSGILNLALENLQVLIRQGKFSKSPKMQEALEQYKESMDPLKVFIKDCLVSDEKSMIPKQYLYNLYKNYVTEKGNHALSDIKFWTRLEEDLKIDKKGSQIEIDESTDENLGKRPRFIKGLKCVSEDILSFDFKGKEVLTKNINFCVTNKLPLLEEEG